MTTNENPTPAQQLEEVRNAFKLAYSDVLQSHRLSGSEPTWDQCFDAGFAALMATPTLRRALAALDAVEVAVRAEFSVLPNDRGWLIDGADDDTQAARLDALGELHTPVLIIPADAQSA